MTTKTSSRLKVLVSLCAVLGLVQALCAQAGPGATRNGQAKPVLSAANRSTARTAKAGPISNAGPCVASSGLDVCIDANLGPEISGPVVVHGGSYQSGGTASGTGSCSLTMIGGGASTAATATVSVNSGIISQGAAFTMTNEGLGYTSAPTQATMSNVSGSAATCSGTATVTTAIGDPLGLTGVAGQVFTILSPNNVVYNASTETYNNLTLQVYNPAIGITLPCSGATAVVTLNDGTAGGNDTLKVSNCSLYLITKTNVVATLTATVAFPAGTIPAPLPLAFSSNLVSSPISQATYSCTSSALCPGAENEPAVLGITGSISTTCDNCPTESLSYTGSPNPISFTVTQGGSAPSPVNVTVTTNPVLNLPYVATTSASWITVNSASQTGGQEGGSFGVSVNPSGLSPGNYSGTVTVSAPDSNSPQPTITVKLTVNSSAPPLSISTTSLQNAEENVAYSQTLAATGGTPPYTWSLNTGSLPAGLTLASSTGVISGTPTGTGFSNFTAKVTDSASNTATSQPLSIAVEVPVTITTPSGALAEGEVNKSYNVALAASGGGTPYTWSVSLGSLPAGLTLGATTGVISGTPSAAVSSQAFSISIKDALGGSGGPVAYTITIASTPSISTLSLPSGSVGATYNATLAASGGVSPYSFSLTSGSLPGGLTLSSAGAITGSPSATGTFMPTFTVTDSLGGTGSKQLTIVVSSGVTITTPTTLTTGEVNAAYSLQFAASGGAGAPFTWSLIGGSLPSGLTLSSGGLLSGTPSAAISSDSFMVQVKDSGGNTGSGTFTLSIITGVSVPSQSPSGGEVGAAYSYTVTASGGQTPYSFSLSSGSLPAGLTLSSSGAISGTSTGSAGTSTFGVTVTDALGYMGTNSSLSITIISGPTITTTSPLPNGTVGVAYSDTLLESGGTGPYTWSVQNGSLPTGLTLSAGGLISGTPPSPTNTPVTFFVVVTDSKGVASPQAKLQLTIISPLSIPAQSLPGGEVGVAYTNTPPGLQASGGVPPYTWSATGLPNGLTLTASNGTISGTPAAGSAGSYTVNVSVKDSASNSAGPVGLPLTIGGVTVPSQSLPNGVVGSAYNATLSATGGTAPYTWALSTGSLPAGLTLSSSGAITGSPSTSVGSPFQFTVIATDSKGSPSPVSPTLSIAVTTGLTVTTTSLLNGTVNVAYSQTLQAAGGVPPYKNWTVASGSLPAGLSLAASTGVISGSPTGAGTSSFTVTVQDSTNATSPASAQLSITIINALAISTTSPLTGGEVGVAYSTTLAATGGTAPYTWSATGLPNGLSLNASTGAITGTPAAGSAGNYTVMASVKDSASNSAGPVSLVLTIAGVTVTPQTLPNGTVNVSYSAMLAATGGTSPYTWAVTGGSFPPGLTLSSAGAISGSPSTNTGSPFSFSVTATDSKGSPSPAVQFGITVGAGLSITTTTLTAGTVNVAYAQTLQATGGVPPYKNWTVTSGSLPAGLSLAASTGTISGTPTATGTSSFMVTVQDSTNTTSPAQSLSITINSATLAITTTTLPAGQVGVAYSQPLSATGGVTPYTWSLTSGSLPAGLTLSAGGTISGTPSTAATSTFGVSVADSASHTAGPQSLSITINPAALAISTTTLSAGTVGAAYNQSLAATGGVSPYTWSLSSGSLPAGLTLSSGGAITGTPGATGTSAFQVSVADSASHTAGPQSLSITINAAALAISTASLPGGEAGAAYSQSLTATGGVSPYTWSVSGGSLPVGLSLSSGGTISGTPATAGTASFTVSVKDSASHTAGPQSLAINVIAGPSVATAILSAGGIGIAYSQTLTATGGAPPYSSWTISSGALPPGLTLSAATGLISGSPSTATGSPFHFSVTVMDSAHVTSAAQSLSIAISTAQLQLTPTSNYTFSLPNTAAPATSTVTIVASDGSAQPVTVTAQPNSYNWLSFSPASGTTPFTITLKANPAGLTPGLYVAPLTATAGAATLSIPAQLTVTGSNLKATPSMLSFTYQPGTPAPGPEQVVVSLVSAGPPVPLSSVTTNVPWLIVGPQTTAPAILTVGVVPGTLTAGTYNGSVLVTGVGSPNSLEIPVTLTVNAEPALTVSPMSLSFTYQIGGTVPAAQGFTVTTGAVGLNYSASSPGTWLTASPMHGPTPGTVMVTVDPVGLGAGTYTGTIAVSAVGASNSAAVAVTLTVTTGPIITVMPGSLTFAAPVGGPAPASQTLMLTGSGSSSIGFTAAGSSWLSVTPASGSTPATLTVSVNPSGLAAGTYNGTVNITQAGSNTPQMIIVTLVVGAGPTPTVSGIINAASGAAGTVAPGMAVSIFGTNLGPATGVSFALPASGGTVATTLGGTQVMFNGTAVPILFASSGQVNALVPFEVSGTNSTQMTVTYDGTTSTTQLIPVVPALPGIFTLNAEGTGQGAIENQDYSVNGPTNPVAPGGYVFVFATGCGLTNPVTVDGSLNPDNASDTLNVPVTATIGGISTGTPEYAGWAPTLVAGVCQINLQVPSSAPSGALPIVITQGPASSQAGVTVFVGTPAGSDKK